MFVWFCHLPVPGNLSPAIGSLASKSCQPTITSPLVKLPRGFLLAFFKGGGAIRRPARYSRTHGGQGSGAEGGPVVGVADVLLLEA